LNSLSDILLMKPFSNMLLHGLLFSAFTLHILFVLLAVGTTILALYYFIHTWWGGRLKELRWDKEILRTFLAHKSLAVVLGVGPLLLFQVAFSVPFFIGVNLFAPFWILVIVFLIIAFLSFDALGHKLYVHHYLHLGFGILAFISLLAVPGIFVAVLVTVENSDKWLTIIHKGYKLSGPLALHWLFRYLHILGAAVVFGAAFHYFFSTENETRKKGAMLKWIVNGILLQFILGIMLYSSLPEKPDQVSNVSLFVGVIGAAVFLSLIFSRRNKTTTLKMKTVLPVLLLILVPMLLVRQFIQDKKLMPLEKQLQVNAKTYQKELQSYYQGALNAYEADIHLVYDNGETIYLKSCAFCHGEKADGNGTEAKSLAIPPEDISALRTTRVHLRQTLIDGVPGSSMPYYTFFDRDKLEGLTDYLNRRYSVLGLPKPIPVNIPDSTLLKARETYGATCTQCHAKDGTVTKLSRGFKPPPPDFMVFSLSPERAFEIVTYGYPGTMMPAFGTLPEEIRWGLVKIINEKRTS